MLIFAKRMFQNWRIHLFASLKGKGEEGFRKKGMSKWKK